MELDNVVAFLAGKAAGGGGTSVTVEELNVTDNGEYTAPSGTAYSPVTVAVPQTTVEPLSVTENGTVTAPSGKAYSPVVVNVPNSYTAGDEGKVVSNGALVAQTAHAEVTQNGMVDTTLNNSVMVNVSGGGDDVLTWTELGTVDCSQNSGNIEVTNLDNYLAFLITANGVVNGSTTASGYGLQINNTSMCDAFIAIAKSGTTQAQYSYAKYNGLFWEIYSMPAATTIGTKGLGNLRAPYSCILNMGKATSIKLGAPTAAYQATSGTIKIYGGK